MFNTYLGRVTRAAGAAALGMLICSGCGAARQQTLLALINNESVQVPRRVVEELAASAARQDVRQALVKRLAHPDPLLEVDLIRAVAKAGRGAVPEIMAALRAEDISDADRLGLLMALGRIGPDSKPVEVPLREILAAPGTPPGLRAAIRVTLADIGDLSRENLDFLRQAVAGDDKVASTTLQMAALGGGAAWADEALVAETVRRLDGQDADTRMWAVAALGRLGAKAGPKTAAGLGQAFQKGIQEVKGNPLLAGLCLACMDRPKAAAYLEPVLTRLGQSGPDEGTTWQMTVARGAILDAPLAVALAGFLDSPRLEVRRGALWALAGVAGLESGAAWRRVLDLAAGVGGESLRRDAVMVLAAILPAQEVWRLETLAGKEKSEEVKRMLDQTLLAVRLAPVPGGEKPHESHWTDDKYLEFLKEKAAGLSKKELNSELDSSAYWGYLRSVEYLLTQGADPNWRDPYTSRTILQGAARNGHGAVLRVLVGAGADINAAGSLGQTALHESVIDGHKAAAEFLIERGANLGIRDSDGMNPLAWAAYVGNLEMTKLLLAHGADVNVHDKGDNTPLIYAIRLVGGSRREVWGMPDHIGVIKALLANGADVNVVNWQGNTPLTVAKEYRRSSVINLLRQHGAREKEK